jgi:hypothetical protein
VLNRNKLNGMRRAARREDWSVVGAIYLDLSLEAAMDRFHLESLAPLVRLRDRDKLIQMVEETIEKQSREEAGSDKLP